MSTYLKGFAVLAKVGASTAAAVAASTSATLSLTANTIDVTTKDDVSSGVLYNNEEVTYVSAELKVDGYQKSAADVFEFDCGDDVKCEFTTGKRKYSFAGLITSMEWSGDKDSVAGYSITIASNGEVAMTTTTG